jgi:hypothetical protein
MNTQDMSGQRTCRCQKRQYRDDGICNKMFAYGDTESYGVLDAWKQMEYT